MSIEADLTRPGTGSGPRAVLGSAAPGRLVASAILGFWDAGTTSRRHAE
jgi:hypothetical protein